MGNSIDKEINDLLWRLEYSGKYTSKMREEKSIEISKKKEINSDDEDLDGDIKEISIDDKPIKNNIKTYSDESETDINTNGSITDYYSSDTDNYEDLKFSESSSDEFKSSEYNLLDFVI